MSRPGRPPRSQQRLLTPEDEALWSSVARSLKPFRRKARVHPSAGHPESLPASEPIGPKLEDELKRAAVEPSTPREAQSQTGRPKSPAKPPPLADFDRRRLKRIAGGRVEIEARLDLHGMRAGEAHSALRSFIFSACAKGQRHVLVITGKGGGAGLSDRPFDLDQPDRGVLKRSVPMWLAEPELRSVVVSFTQAHPRHGGEGALYVQLRSRRRRPDHRE
jgi:DNA-nicking Smr family endonuclease